MAKNLSYVEWFDLACTARKIFEERTIVWTGPIPTLVRHREGVERAAALAALANSHSREASLDALAATFEKFRVNQSHMALGFWADHLSEAV